MSASVPARTTRRGFLVAGLGLVVSAGLGLGALAMPMSALADSAAESEAVVADSIATPSVFDPSDAVYLGEVVAAKCLPSLATIYCFSDDYRGYSQGSGSVIDAENGYILTNYHVIENCDSFKVFIGGNDFEGTLVGSDPTSDVAILQVDLSDHPEIPAIAIGTSATLRPGQWCMTIGTPGGEADSVAQGIVSALNRTTIIQLENVTAYYVGCIQTDAMINSGSSGGALVNADGELIGITTYGPSDRFDGMSYAIPIDYAMRIVNQILTNGYVEHPRLGVIVTETSLAYYRGLIDKDTYQANPDGAYISGFSEGADAGQSGLREGDIITRIDDVDIVVCDYITIAVRKHDVGDTVEVTVLRDGEEMTFPVVLTNDLDAGTTIGNTPVTTPDSASFAEYLEDILGNSQGEAGNQGDNVAPGDVTLPEPAPGEEATVPGSGSIWGWLSGHGAEQVPGRG